MAFSFDLLRAPASRYDGWSARFTGLLQPSFTELYRLIVTSDDGVRLWVDGELRIDEWDARSSINFCFVELKSGHYHDFVLEYVRVRSFVVLVRADLCLGLVVCVGSLPHQH